MKSTFILPLAWTRNAPPLREEADTDSLWAVGVGGHYQAQGDGLLWMAHDPFVWQRHANQHAAMKAAQSDHEARLRSLLSDLSDMTSATGGGAALRAEADKLEKKAATFNFMTCNSKHRDAVASFHTAYTDIAMQLRAAAKTLEAPFNVPLDKA